MSFSRACRRLAALTAGVTALTLGLALPALAHVTINPSSAQQGGFTKVAFRVPNERDDASTTRLEVTFPVDHPLAFVSVKPVPGWDVKVVEGKLPKPVTTEYGEVTEAVTKVTWSGGKIEPGQFQEFEVSMGALPTDVDRLIFPAVQTYSGGEVVRWDDEPKADGSEPEHPAPVLTLTPAAAEGAGTGTSASAAPASTSPATPSAAGATRPTATAVVSGASDGTARLLGGAGLVLGLAGLVLGALALRRGRTA
ncbi:YcnI family protein [Streptosporangium sp. NPDC050855]|uniref:YcnI family protein n=1 Tax=Streptosporangium sp. NPDC050855 TaxID=3366194 RepID=UPI0037B7B5E8